MGSGDGSPTLVHAMSAEARPLEGGFELELRDVHLWGGDLRVRTRRALARVDDPDLTRRLGMLGPPNATRSPDLDLGDPHQSFTWHRRLALPAMAPLWALLGALLGAAAGGTLAVAVGAGSVACGYWLLRTGELSARAGLLDPGLAAWAPALVLALLLALLGPRLARRLS